MTVKAYPSLSAKYGEAVCVAGFRLDGESPAWVRLYPVEFRDLAFTQRFKKYDVIRLKVRRHQTDRRPETLRPDCSSLQILGHIDTKRNWAERRAIVEPAIVSSMCEIRRREPVDGTSLGAFRPAEVMDFTIEDEPDPWDSRKAGIANQLSLADLTRPTKQALEKLPFRFRYKYRCSDAACTGHHQMSIDWELGQAARSWPAQQGYSREELLQKLRQKFFDEICGPAKDVVFFVGNQYLRPDGFMILGVFWPNRI